MGVLVPMFLLNGCLGNDEEVTDIIDYTDAELVSFSLTHDSIPELATTLFTIDQVLGTVYNHDSLAYGTAIEGKAIVTYTSGANITNLMLLGEEDSTWIASGDSLEISQPLKFQVYAYNGITTKNYTFQVNIHQVDPDSVQYRQIASGLNFIESAENRSIYFNSKFYFYVKNNDVISLYSSNDAISWSQESLAGLPNEAVVNNIVSYDSGILSRTESGDLYISFDAVSWAKVTADYPVTSILGYLKGSSIQEGGICLVVNKNDNLTFAFSSDLLEWSYGGILPEGFPANGFSPVNQEIALLQRLTVFGGKDANDNILNSIWSTQDGLYWAKVSDDRFSKLPNFTDGNVFLYNGKLCLINGYLGEGEYNSEFYISEDNGYTWKTQESKYKSLEYDDRSGASVIVDNEGEFIYILGGDKDSVWSEVWKVFQNRAVFDH
ncbi:DUF6242 domain-containing protein [Bacteroidales bacterium OttesenSCG-928-A17]|nr:DUF6242 domain-containing protein [Bacteroidales bacterium OttesenSCG-928-A17]